jgi:hypothetical protein
MIKTEVKYDTSKRINQDQDLGLDTIPKAARKKIEEKNKNVNKKQKEMLLSSSTDKQESPRTVNSSLKNITNASKP